MREPNSKRLPKWMYQKKLVSKDNEEIKKLLRRKQLKSVCESAKCPNISECFKKPTATFLILGDICTRACKFCNIHSGKPYKIDPNEPENVALSVKELNLKHVVITSVDRDDLPDLGLEQFIKTIRAIRKIMPPSTSIEILTPDFKAKKYLLKQLFKEEYEIFNHNLETVPNLYSKICPQSNYEQSLFVLNYIKSNSSKITKTGIIVGLGEKDEEIYSLIKDIKKNKVDALTIGQYLRPNKNNIEVDRYVKPEIFQQYEKKAKEIGIKYVYASPFVRSSYNAEELINSLRK